MEELDLLKKDWKKNENSFSQVSESEIYKMLHKKSSSIVKWILIISILEVLLWTAVSFLFNSDDYLKKFNHDEILTIMKCLTYLNYAVILVFIYLFYKNYKMISTTVSTKQLMKDILKTRKTVQYYVWYNLGMVVFSFVLGIVFAFAYNPDIVAMKDKLAHNGKMTAFIIVFLVLVTVVFFGIFWLFYRLLYGILLKKLFRNYQELKKIDL